MVATRFQTRNEEEIEQLLRDKSSKSTNEVFNEVLKFMIYDLFYTLITEMCKHFALKSLADIRSLYCSILSCTV